MSPRSGISTGISVIIPVHNRTRELMRALESLVAQRDPLLEVVVCDDGSSEDIGAIVEAFQGRLHVKLLRTPASGGPAKPRNLAVAVASAAWVSFLDSDDEWLPGRTAAIRPLLSNHVDVLYHRLDVRCEDSFAGSRHAMPAHVGTPLRGRDVLASLIRWGNPLATSGVTIRRDMFLAQGGFCESLNSVDDFDLWLRLAASGARFAHLPVSLGVYWVGVGSISRRGLTYEYERYRALFERQLELLPEVYRPLAESSFGYVLARKARQAGLRTAAAEHFRKVRPLLTPRRWFLSQSIRSVDALMGFARIVRR
jgi:glycosyltransferase involved in cell wall biosynthesis